jgi:hypothetical protein
MLTYYYETSLIEKDAFRRSMDYLERSGGERPAESLG